MSELPNRPLVPRPKGMKQELVPPTYPTTPALPSPTTPRSILKTPAAPKSDSSGSSTAGSPKSRKRIVDEHGQVVPKMTKARQIKEGAFFAFVLLPLSCWYTRGGKRLRELDELENEPFRPRPSQQLQRWDSMSANPGRHLPRRSSLSTAPTLHRRSSVSVSVPMQSPGPGRW